MTFSIHKQKGINLIELMIASVLSIMISFFIIRIMTTTNQTSSRSEGIAQAQETSRFILSWLNSETKRAGFQSITTDPNSSSLNPALANLCGVANTTPPANGGNCTLETTDAAGDRLALRRTFSTTSPDPRDATDCTGVDLTGMAGLTNNVSVLTDVYWVELDDTPPDTEEEVLNGSGYNDVLRCVTYDENGIVISPAQTLASGIEGMQILYAKGQKANINGLYVADDYGALEYQSADMLADFVSGALEDIIAVRIAILTRSFSTTSLDPATRSYILLDGDSYTFDDRVARQILSTTISLKNISPE